MRYDLAAMTKRAGTRRRGVVQIATFAPTQTQKDALARIYMQVVRAWAVAVKERLLPAYERALDRVTRDDVSQAEGEVSGAEEELRRLLLVLTPELRNWAIREETWHRGKWRAAVLRATGIDINVLIGPDGARETIAAFLARNTALIKDVSAQAQGKISDAVFRAYQNRVAPRELAKDLRDILQTSRRRAINIAADQTQKLAAALDQERRREAGVDSFRWMHSQKAHPRAEHVARDGVVYSDKNPPPDMPGELPYCGCKAMAVLQLN